MVAPFPHFSPHRPQPHPCWHCASLGRLLYCGTAGECDRPGASPVQAGPAESCVYWIREVGADDKPGPPGMPMCQLVSVGQATNHTKAKGVSSEVRMS